MSSSWGTSWGDSWGTNWNGATAASAGIFLPEPDGISFDDWGARVTEEFAQCGVPVPFNESLWRDWACSLFYVSTLTSKGIPSPDGFPDWRSWARRFLECVR